jgi:Rps23 Pro-64 3,4-dihydroxylase Tpa1-like proline 4-hydroxylase
MKYLIRDNFLPNSYIEFVRLELRRLQSALSYDGYDNHKTMRDELDPRYAATTYITDKQSVLYSIWNKYFWEQAYEDMRSSEDSALVHASHTRFGKILFSAYGNSDYYGHHVDIDLDCVATAVLMLTLRDPQQFTGGAFLLEDTPIEFKNNRLIVFPSCRMHGVEPVKLEDNSYDNRRFTIQYFISSVTRRGRFADEGHYK